MAQNDANMWIYSRFRPLIPIQILLKFYLSFEKSFNPPFTGKILTRRPVRYFFAENLKMLPVPVHRAVSTKVLDPR
jgi:hypothetical protein